MPDVRGASAPKLKLTGRRYIIPFVALTVLACAAVGAALAILLGNVGILLGVPFGALAGHFSYHFAFERWGGWEWVDRA